MSFSSLTLYLLTIPHYSCAAHSSSLLSLVYSPGSLPPVSLHLGPLFCLPLMPVPAAWPHGGRWLCPWAKGEGQRVGSAQQPRAVGAGTQVELAL